MLEAWFNFNVSLMPYYNVVTTISLTLAIWLTIVTEIEKHNRKITS